MSEPRESSDPLAQKRWTLTFDIDSTWFVDHEPTDALPHVEVMSVSEHEKAVADLEEEVRLVSEQRDIIASDYEALSNAAAVFYGDAQHPDQADYVATNLLDALQQVPDTGDWHGALRAWCERTITGRLRVNRTGDPAKSFSRVPSDHNRVKMTQKAPSGNTLLSGEQ